MLRSFGADVAWNASVHPKAVIDFPWNVTLGLRSMLDENSWTYALAKITIGEKSTIGKEVYLITGTHDISSPEFDLVVKPITIGSGAWVATRATILPGVEIGELAVVAAGAVVSKSVAPQEVVGGNPARIIKKREMR